MGLSILIGLLIAGVVVFLLLVATALKDPPVIDYTSSSEPLEEALSAPDPQPWDAPAPTLSGPYLKLMGKDGAVHSLRRLRGEVPERIERLHGPHPPTIYERDPESSTPDLHLHWEQ